MKSQRKPLIQSILLCAFSFDMTLASARQATGAGQTAIFSG
jgi:hypothetical protein